MVVLSDAISPPNIRRISALACVCCASCRDRSSPSCLSCGEYAVLRRWFAPLLLLLLLVLLSPANGSSLSPATAAAGGDIERTWVENDEDESDPRRCGCTTLLRARSSAALRAFTLPMRRSTFLRRRAFSSRRRRASLSLRMTGEVAAGEGGAPVDDAAADGTAGDDTAGDAPGSGDGVGVVL